MAWCWGTCLGGEEEAWAGRGCDPKQNWTGRRKAKEIAFRLSSKSCNTSLIITFSNHLYGNPRGSPSSWTGLPGS